MNTYTLLSSKVSVSHFASYPFIIEAAAYLAVIAFVLIILTLVGIVYHRFTQKKLLRLYAFAEKEILHELEGHLHLYGTVTEMPEAEMKNNVIQLIFLKNKNVIYRRSMVKLLLYFHSNLTGAISNIISSTFSRLKLREFTLGKLRSSLWYKKTQGLTEVQEMQDRHSLPEVYKLVNDSNQDVRIATYRVLLTLKTSDCYDYLVNEKVEISLWHQIMLENAISNAENPNLPEFKDYLTSANKSIVILFVRLIVVFKQLNAIPRLLSLLDSDDEDLRNVIIKAIGAMNAVSAEERLIEIYKTETDKNKSAILFSLGHIGSGTSLDFIGNSFLETKNFTVMKSAASAIFAHPKNLKNKILKSLTGCGDDHRAMLRNFE